VTDASSNYEAICKTEFTFTSCPAVTTADTFETARPT